jgi:phage-related protein
MPRRISWVKAAFRVFEDFPEPVRRDIVRALRLAANGEKAASAKPLKGFGSGVLEIAIRHRGDAFRAVYVVQIHEDLWVLHAFQKKSKSGIKTPQQEIDLIGERLKRLKEQLS